MEKEKLMKEYFKRFNTIVYKCLKVSGFNRFDIKNEKIVEKPVSSLFYTLFIVFFTDSCTFYILYVTVWRDNYLLGSEIVILVQLAVINNLMILNIAFGNRKRGSEMINSCIEIDTFLGVEETKFLRDIDAKTYVALSIIVIFSEVTVLATMNFTFLVDFSIKFIGLIIIYLMYYIYIDCCMLLRFSIFLAMRVRYLNLSLANMAHVKLEYIPYQFLFNGIYWKQEYDDLVVSQTKVTPEKIIPALKLIFEQIRRLEKSYTVCMLLCPSSIIVGAFATVQTYISYIKYEDVETIRTIAMTAWLLTTWIFLLGFCLQTDIFHQQIQQTELICCYIKLKPSNQDEIYKLTKDIYGTLEAREPRFNILGLFYLDTGFILRITTSILVYVTVQIQFAFPTVDKDILINNTTTI